ncbi:MAG: type VI secretion system baseplate subunit TssG [Alphaproteobacteria bacterium]
MAGNRRNTTPSLKQTLIDDADQFEFHAIVKILEGMKKESVPLGEGVSPEHESVRIQTHVSMNFPTTDVHDLVWSDDSQVPPLLTTNFLGIAGIQGPLPTPYTQILMERDSQKDGAFHGFLDIFNHRLVSLFHRIRKKHWVGVSGDEPEKTFVGLCLKALLGLSGKELSNRLNVPDRSLLYYAGLLWQRPRSEVGLVKLLTAFFRLPVSISQFQGRWIRVPESQRTSIGAKGSFARLGDTAIIGDRFWEQQADFTLHIGPMTLDRYIDLLKPAPSYKSLKSLALYYVGKDQDFKINLILDKQEKPQTRLGFGMALGWTAWVNSYSPPQDTPDRQNIMTLRPFKGVPGRYHA